METRIDRLGSVRDGKIQQLKELIAESENIVFLGGAGVSTESGIPDFRSGTGIYNQDSGVTYRPIDIIARGFNVSSTTVLGHFSRVSNKEYNYVAFLSQATKVVQYLRDILRFNVKGILVHVNAVVRVNHKNVNVLFSNHCFCLFKDGRQLGYVHTVEEVEVVKDVVNSHLFFFVG